jgi:uncharacterized protein with GYD domain
MPMYKIEFSYTPEAWAALCRNPEDRSAPVRTLASSMGGRLVDFYYSFGEYDGFAIVETPDNLTAGTAALVALSPGHLKSVKTTPIFTVDEAMAMMRRAGEITFRAPGR